ncbi:MAG: hypothetical protein H7A37_09850 [Chlamydiales bacterium]|nr:hypothetical protein [Chlamydiia bacterium]MCP5508579.1 hypothetical protein [Chlamydiales bacterium]
MSDTSEGQIDPLNPSNPMQFKDLIAAANSIDLTSVHRLGGMHTQKPTEKLTKNQLAKRMVDDASIGPERKWAEYNEYLVYLFDQLPEINGFFNLPKITLTYDEDNKPKTQQEFIQSEGTYLQFTKEDKEKTDNAFNTLAAQKFAIIQILMKAEDAHALNILISRDANGELIPIPIDYGRSLTHDPNDPTMVPRTTRWETWPALEKPTDPSIIALFDRINPENLVTNLKAAFHKEVNDPAFEERLDLKLTHLEANLYMIKAAMKKKFTVKQTLALILPAMNKYTFNMVTKGVISGGSLWPARDRYIKLHTSFLAVWNKSLHWRRFKMDTFIEKIEEEVEKVSRLTPEQLHEKYFEEMCYELRRGLFL